MITILDLINAFLFILQSNSSRRGVNRRVGDEVKQAKALALLLVKQGAIVQF